MNASPWHPLQDLVGRFFDDTLEKIREIADPAAGLPEIDPEDRCRVLAIGKSSVAQAGSVLRRLEDRGTRIEDALAVTKLEQDRPEGLEVLVGNHPVPGARSERAATRLLELADRPVDTEIVLVSGGASSLVTKPRPPARLGDLAALTRAAMRSGLCVEEMNSIRRALCEVKNGGLFRSSRARRRIGRITVDVPSRDPAAVASGPLYFRTIDGAAIAAVLDILGTSGGLERDVRSRIDVAIGHAATMPEPDAAGEISVVATDLDLRRCATDWLEAEGFHVLELGEADNASSLPIDRGVDLFVDRVCGALTGDRGPHQPMRSNLAFVTTGEFEVRGLGSDAGRGGRCSMFVTALAHGLFGSESPITSDGIAIVAIASDGDDGRSERSGGFLTTEDHRSIETMAPGKLAEAIRTGRTAEVLDRLGRSFPARSTGTNLMDLYAVLIRPGGPQAVPGLR